MKTFIVLLIVVLSGCCSTPDKKYTKLKKQELAKEYALGTQAGTPDNLELLNASREKRAYYRAEAKRKKTAKKDCFIARLFCSLFSCHSK